MWPHLFICKNEQHGVSEFVLSEHSGQLLPRLVHSLPVVAVHHEDEPCSQKHSSLLAPHISLVHVCFFWLVSSSLSDQKLWMSLIHYSFGANCSCCLLILFDLTKVQHLYSVTDDAALNSVVLTWSLSKYFSFEVYMENVCSLCWLWKPISTNKRKKIVYKTEPDEKIDRFYISHNSSVSDHSHFTSLLLYIHYDIKGEIIRYEVKFKWKAEIVSLRQISYYGIQKETR